MNICATWRGPFRAASIANKQTLAEVIAKHIPAFERHVPPPRKPWMSEDARMGLFDAAAWALVFFQKANRLDYQCGGWGFALVPETGFRGKLVNNDLAADAAITHFNIDDDSRIHADVLREVDAPRQGNAKAIPLPRSRRK